MRVSKYRSSKLIEMNVLGADVLISKLNLLDTSLNVNFYNLNGNIFIHFVSAHPHFNVFSDCL